MYKVYGDYGYVNETLLESFQSLDEAVRWMNSYVEDNSMGGYNLIEVAWFNKNNEYCVEARVDAEQEL